MRHGPIADNAEPRVKGVAAALADHGGALSYPGKGEAFGEFFDRLARN